MLKEGEICKIEYRKDDGEITDRTIIPIKIPSHIKALDVSGLNPTEQAQLQQLYQQYTSYVKERMSTMFDFTNWCEHTGNEIPGELRWRTFKQHNTTIR